MPASRNTTRNISKTKKPDSQTVPVYEPNVPVPTCRAELLKYWMNFTLDDKTANRVLWISEGGAKVTRRTKELCPVLDRPERYAYSPQVLCKEGIWNMRAYWEVEYTGWVFIGTTCEGAARSGHSGPSGLGEYEDSVALGWSGTCYQMWYSGTYTEIRNVPCSPTFGVYVDQPAGIINFYQVMGEEGEEKEVRLLHSIQAPLKEKIMPGFWVGIQSSCTILKKPQ